jgi:hypothetical protein
MYERSLSVFMVGIFAIATSAAPRLIAQAPAQPAAPDHQHQHDTPPQEPDGSLTDLQVRDSSGTAWLPDATPMYAVHTQRNGWLLMTHGNAFVQFLSESGDRGSDQFGSINWAMGMAQRRLGTGNIQVRAMLSAEMWTVGTCGYPDLLATGEQCDGEPIHDRQHPHDLVMELSARYDAPFAGPVRWQVYGGPVGEPALGPVAYPHRISAMPNPLAPIAHHWLDSSHVTFGVMTGALYGSRWKAEASVFNGREPDDQRADFDLGALDSVAGRLWWLPTPRLALQVSAARLAEAEADEHGGPAIDVTRATASATYHGMVRDGGVWATTIAWGRNVEAGQGSNAFLAETSLTLRDRDTWFGRFETVKKTAHDLAVAETDDGFFVAKLQGGYTRYLTTWRSLKPGVGGGLSVGLVPEALQDAYGSRANPGFGVFFTLRPAAMTMHQGHGAM